MLKRIVLLFGLASALALTSPAAASASASWSVTLLEPMGGLWSASCPSASFCAVTARKIARTYNGTSWSAPVTIDENIIAAGRVSCPSASFCTALDQNLITAHAEASIYNGSSWGAPASIPSGSGVYSSISCSSASFCAAVTNEGYAATYNGSSWSAPVNIDSGFGDFDSVSCTSATFCVAIERKGNAVRYDGASWTVPASTGGTELVSLSCASASFCVAVTGGGSALTYNGTSWSSVKVDGHPLNEISCTSSTFCLATDTYSEAVLYNGSSWSSPERIIGYAGLSSQGTPEYRYAGLIAAVSCASTTFCLAVDQYGQAFTYLGDVPPPPPTTTTTGVSVAPRIAVSGTASRGPGSSPSVPSATHTRAPISAAAAFSLPSAAKCVSRRHFTVHVRRYPGVTWIGAVIKINGKRIKALGRSQITAFVNLIGLPKGRFVLSITATASDGRKAAGTRTYHTCVPKSKRHYARGRL